MSGCPSRALRKIVVTGAKLVVTGTNISGDRRTGERRFSA